MKKQTFAKWVICGSIFAACFAVGCSKTKTEVVVKDELADILLTTEVDSCDFADGVNFVDSNGAKVQYVVDSSAVQFGKSGRYVVVYNVNGEKFEREVYIYDDPTILVKNSTISYKDASEKNFSVSVSAEDSFQNEIALTYISGLTYNQNGQLETGKKNFTFSAIDCLGNISEEVVSLTIAEPTDSFAQSSVTVDYSKPFYTFALENRKFISAYTEGQALDSSFYVVDNGYLMFTPSLIEAIGVGNQRTVYINLNTCSAEIEVAVTDNQPLSYEAVGNVEGEFFYLDDLIVLPYYRLMSASIQDAEFKYYVKLGEGRTQIFDGKFKPTLGGAYTYIAEVYHNGQLVNEITQNFEISHYCEEPVRLNRIIALGVENDLSLRADETVKVPVVYTLKNNDGVVQCNNGVLVGVKEGSATVEININDGEITKTVDVRVVDFGNAQGRVKDLSKDITLWGDFDGTMISSEKVADLRTTVSQYEYEAISARDSAFLSKDVIESAKSVGYKYLTFYASLDSENKNLYVDLCDADGVAIVNRRILNQANSGRWTYYSLPLSDIDENCGIVFSSDAIGFHLAKVEFVGADIGNYVSTFIQNGNITSKSADLICDDLIDSLCISTCNTNKSFSYTETGMDRVSSTDNGDYFTFTRSGYFGGYLTSENVVYINSEWIQAAKMLGYATLGVWIGPNVDYSYMKRSADGTVSPFLNGENAWHGKSSTWSFISLDLTSFEDGDVVLIGFEGNSIQIGGITFRTSGYGAPNLTIK